MSVSKAYKRQAAKKLRLERKSQGVCASCGAPPAQGYLCCQSCLDTKAEATKKSRLKTVLEVQTAYGGKCVCPPCGETETKFLTLDHINDDGGQHRRNMNGRGNAVYTWVKQNNFPETLRLMCFNCNSGRQRNGGVCPHLTNGQL